MAQVTPRPRLVATAAVVALLLIAGFVTNFYLSRAALDRSQHAWCAILALALAEPTPAHPTVKQQTARRDIQRINAQYGCT